MPDGFWVKICGVRTVGDIESAVSAGADAVGLVMTPSVRQLTLEEAARLLAAVPEGLTTVAVFYQPDPTWVTHVRNTVPFDLFQAEPGPLSQVAGIRAFPVVHDGPRLGEDASRAIDLAGIGRILVESAGKGGQGRSADWGRVAGLPDRDRVVLAGGLGAENVGEAISRSGVGGVDVSSGVESSPGVKDRGLIRDFVAAARNAAAGMHQEVGR